MVGPAADRAPGRRQPHLQRGHHQREADANHHERSNGAESVAIKSNGEARRGDEKSDRRKRKRDAAGKRRRPHAVPAGRRTQNDRQEWQNAGRQDG